jgi:hypothetical protein
MGLKYCKVLGTAASRNTDWEEASDKLNQLLFSRIAEGRSLRVTANPINLVDLEHLKTWSGKNDYEKRGRKSCILEYRPVHQICFAGWICLGSVWTHRAGRGRGSTPADRLKPQSAEVVTASAVTATSPLNGVTDASAS